MPAIEAFFRSIALGEQRKLQDILRLLTLWFQHGGTPSPPPSLLVPR